MISYEEIKKDLKEIRYYYSRKDLFDSVSTSVGEHAVTKKLDKYNNVVKNADPRLFDLYISLYLQNNTQESLSEKMGYSFETVNRLNKKLVRFIKSELDKEEK